MYNRTQNENGSYNSRCLDCFMTIASCVETEKELDTREANHTCPEKALAQMKAEDGAATARATLS
jgi:ABC-type Fe3+-citrate transport system substrate-binding protein